MNQNFIRLFVSAAALTLALLPIAGADERDAFGAWTALQTNPNGFFQTEQIDGIWWLVSPKGNALFSKGVNTVSYTADVCPSLGYAPYGRATSAKYGSAPKWAQATAARLRQWNFNTVGAWSSPEMFGQHLPYTLVIGAAVAGGANWERGEVADVFSPAFQQAVFKQVQKVCAPHANDPYLLGYFTDNELRWSEDWRSKVSLFEIFFARPMQSAGKMAALRVLRNRYGDMNAFNRAWGMQVVSWDELAVRVELPTHSEAAKRAHSDFLREYARTYFATCRAAIRAVDPKHLILGCRFAGSAPQEVAEAMRIYVDVVSFNNYGNLPPVDQLRRLYQITEKPILLTEFSFKANDSGLPNTRGAGKPLATQEERAENFQNYVTALAKLPFVIGYHWFEYADEPAQGRFDGENSNYGLVDIKDDPWQALVDRMTQVNSGIEPLHRQAKAPSAAK